MPRRKLTKPKDLDDLRAVADDLPEITDQQQRFVEGLLSGMSASDAYRAAYDCSTATQNTVWVNAARLARDAKITRWLSAARQACLGTAVLTKDAHVQQLERLREHALDSGNVGAAVQAEHYRGKVGGYYVERYEDLTPPNPLPLMERLATLSPAFADAIASQMRLAKAIDITPNAHPVEPIKVRVD
jgi:hypothetical protein